jgi:hypothetical protein
MNRRTLARMALWGAAIATLVAGGSSAVAGSTGLDGGGGCYGTGSTTYGSSVVDARTFSGPSPCNQFAQVYLAANTPPGYADLNGQWGYLGIFWGTSAPSVTATHNLCHMGCNGFVDTSAP